LFKGGWTVTIGRVLLLASALLISAPIAGAEERLPIAPDAPPRSLAAHEILSRVRSGGFDPVGQPMRRGPRYEVAAVDPYELDVRLVVDAQTGQILAVRHDPEFADPPVAGPTYAQWQFRRSRESRPIPPRDIPAGRPTEVAKLKTPLPLPRPRPDDVTGSIKIVPVAPLE
jgi:hypothetical protein